MKHLKKVYLLGLISTIGVTPISSDYLNAAVPLNKKMTVADLYNNAMLKIIEDSLKRIDSRNYILPELGLFIAGRVFFGVTIYSNRSQNSQQNVTINEKRGKINPYINGAYNLAYAITPCSYNPTDVIVGVRYIENNEVHPFLGTIINLSRPTTPCTAAFSFSH
jgi:hypothetical protein